MKDVRRYQLIALVAALLALTVAFVRPKESAAPTNNANTGTNTNTVTNTALNTNAATNSNLDTDRFFAADLPDADPVFNFSMLLGAGWTAEYDSRNKAILVSDPRATGAKQLRLKISYYRGSEFAPPSGTAVPDTTDAAPLGDDNGPMVREVQVKTPTQIPSWGSEAHWEVDVTVPGIDKLYYRFDFAPDISRQVAINLIQSLDFGGSER